MLIAFAMPGAVITVSNLCIIRVLHKRYRANISRRRNAASLLLEVGQRRVPSGRPQNLYIPRWCTSRTRSNSTRSNLFSESNDHLQISNIVPRRHPMSIQFTLDMFSLINASIIRLSMIRRFVEIYFSHYGMHNDVRGKPCSCRTWNRAHTPAMLQLIAGTNANSKSLNPSKSGNIPEDACSVQPDVSFISSMMKTLTDFRGDFAGAYWIWSTTSDCIETQFDHTQFWTIA
ncbi:hypothetical protein D915_006886 [Fasciola hepatica]|uniref:Uncharacterized protein n=1 Tax=Fasciola hepatica TaxID=6192 RepID=A0A4E0R2D3_FASHE|nr:hypothetical protein D915_006886 [Fasciola hepatica]